MPPMQSQHPAGKHEDSLENAEGSRVRSSPQDLISQPALGVGRSGRVQPLERPGDGALQEKVEGPGRCLHHKPRRSF